MPFYAKSLKMGVFLFPLGEASIQKRRDGQTASGILKKIKINATTIFGCRAWICQGGVECCGSVSTEQTVSTAVTDKE